jgi:hypothetical protein
VEVNNGEKIMNMNKIIYIDVVSAIAETQSICLHPRLLFSPSEETLPLSPDLPTVDAYSELIEELGNDISFGSVAPYFIYDDKLTNEINAFINKFIGIENENRKFVKVNDELILNENEFIASCVDSGRLIIKDWRDVEYTPQEFHKLLIPSTEDTELPDTEPKEHEVQENVFVEIPKDEPIHISEISNKPSTEETSKVKTKHQKNIWVKSAIEKFRLRKKEERKPKSERVPRKKKEVNINEEIENDDYHISIFSVIFIMLLMVAFAFGFYYFQK